MFISGYSTKLVVDIREVLCLYMCRVNCIPANT